jgi:hypothetical protein
MSFPRLPGFATNFRFRLSAVGVWFLLACCLVLMVVSLVLYEGNPDKPAGTLFNSPIWTLLVMPYPIAGVLIASYHPKNPIGWLFCVLGFIAELLLFSVQYASLSFNNWPASLPLSVELIWLAALIWPVILCLLAFVFLLFPSGQLTSKNWRWAAWLTAATGLLTLLSFGIIIWPSRGPVLVKFLASPDLDLLLAGSGVLGIFALITYWLCGICLLIALISLMFRFKNANGISRLQLKWFALTSTPLAVTATVSAGTTAISTFNEPVAKTIAYSLTLLPICCLPIAVGFAMLRYHLYDIDLLINRALVYISLTVTLTSLYYGIVILLQALLRALTGRSSELAVVATTLVIAALFLPLRRGIQSYIDQRFYRRKYDAARTLLAFSQMARNEVNLDALTGRLVGVVGETMQPAHVSIWLRPVVENRDHSD